MPKTIDDYRECFSEPIGSIYYAAILLSNAVEAHLEGDTTLAKNLIRAADMSEIGEWLDPIWLRRSELVQPIEVPDAPPIIPKQERAKSRMPTAQMKRDLIYRDGHHCKFCSMPVVRAEVRREINRLYPIEARWHSNKAVDQHRGLQVMWLQYDHLLVHSRGGATSMENLVITCAACNFGRESYTLEEMRFLDPRTYVRVPDWLGHSDWNGLENILPEKKRVVSH